MQWTLSCFFLFTYLINFVATDDRCRTEVNIRGMALKGFVFKKMTVTAPHMCDVRCEREITCQSYNYVRKENLCELNNRTKEARPENFRSDPARFYIRRLNGRGMHPVRCNACCFLHVFISLDFEGLYEDFLLKEKANGLAI